MLQRAGIPSRKPRPNERARRRPGPWIALFAAALAIRVLSAWLAAGPGTPPEAPDYDAVAARLAAGAGFSLEGPAGPHTTASEAPVGPWLTSLVYRVTGHRPLAAILFQCAIGALVPLLLAGCASSIFGGNVGRVAGWLAALDPLLVVFSGRIGPETVFTALLLAAITGSAAWVKTPRPARALGVGLLWGIASLTWPAALALPAVIAAWAWVPLGLTVPARERLRHMMLLLLGLALAVGPWTARNALALHAFVPISTGGGRALLDGNNPVVWSDPLLRGGAIRASEVEPYASELRGRGEVEADAIARRRALQFVAEHAGEAPAAAAAKLARFWRPTAERGASGGPGAGPGAGAGPRSSGGPGAALPPGRALEVVDPFLVWSLLAWPLAAWGLLHTLRGPRRFYQSLGLLVVLYVMAVATVFWGGLRMRVPAEPMLLLFAAVGFEDVRRRVRMRARALHVIGGRR
jgi:4-amino-4-deoxy-L-arabinose transferase-like glycosyltransferase